MDTNDKLPIPTKEEFLSWSSDEVAKIVKDKTVVFAPGGTSRWYFLEHGDVREGYNSHERFREYAYKGLERIIEIANMMCNDGVSTVFSVAHMPNQSTRNKEYNENLKWVYELFADEYAYSLYDKYDLGISFRGKWESAFDQPETNEAWKECKKLEAKTSDRSRRLVWLTHDDLLPQSLTPLISDSIQKTGQLPTRTVMASAYYGRDLDHVDIFLSNNKLSIKDMTPSLLTVGDLYFTVSPSFYMERSGWRKVLYDHIFARQGHFRDYKKLSVEDMTEMRTFYQRNQETIMGVGVHHEKTQTWRPDLTLVAPDQISSK